MSALFQAQVLQVHHWTDTLFSFITERDGGFRFGSGQFTMVGLPVDGRPLLRAFSMVSAHYDDHLEFLSVKIPGGALTSRLQHVKPGDRVFVGRKATGTLVGDQLLPGKRLYLLSTGTGLAPFLSLVKDPSVYEQFEEIILTHTCRRVADLVYGDFLTRQLPEDEFLGPMVKKQLRYYPSVTREPFHTPGRITDLIRSGRMFEDLGVEPLNPETDRLMICGSPAMLADTKALLLERGLRPGDPGEPGHFVWEKAFAE